MLCKEEVCQWFRNLSGPKRVDLVSGLLQMCLPLEIRFVGSCVEDLARRNYHFLRESEIKANDLNEVGTLGHMLDDVTRSKLNIYLALLHSNNRVCSNAMFNTLTCPEPLHQRMLLNLPNSARMRLAEELLLLYTMAAHHPAFTFSQRQVLFAKLQAVQQLLENDKDETSDSASSTNCSVSNSPSTSTIMQQHSPNPAKKVYVRNIEVKGSQGTPDRRREFHIQVKWSDGEVTETYKTYQALHAFHAELIKLFPKDSGAHKQYRQIPFFPSEKGPGHVMHGPKELTEVIRKYVKQLVALPDHIIQCSHITRFLQNKPSEKEARSPLTVRGVDEEPVTSTGSGHKGSMTFYNSNISDGRRAPSDKHGRSPMRPQIPTASSVTIHSNQRHVYSNTGSSPSPFSSPMQSPLSSPHVSPSTSHYSSRSGSPRSSSGKFDVSAWLKQARLHKYQEGLDGYTPDELLKLTDIDLEKVGLTLGARKKFHAEIDKLRLGIKNGLVTSGSSVGSRATSPGSPWHSPPHNNVHLSPPVSQSQIMAATSHNSLPTIPQPVHQNSQCSAASKGPFPARMDSVENSSDYFENISPPTSPGRKDAKSPQSECPLMDEVDRENERESLTWAMEKEDEREPFQNNIPQGAIVESRPHVTAVYPKQDGNHNNNAFMSAGGMEVKIPHMMEGVPVPYAPGMPRPMMQMESPQMPMFFTHRPNIRSQHPPLNPPRVTPAIIQNPKLPNMNGSTHVVYENGPLLQVTKVSVHDHMPSSTAAITVSMNALTTVDTLPTYNSKSMLGYPVPTAVVSNGASRPVTLALPTSIGNATMTYSVAPTIASVDIGKCHTGAAPPSLHPIIPTSVVDSNTYIAYHNVQSVSSTFTSSFQGQGAPVAATPVQTPGPTPTHNPVQLQGVSSNVSTPLQTPVTGVPQLPHAPALVATPPAPPVASQSNPHPSASAPSCSTCGCNGHCTTVASASNPGYPQVMWHQHPMIQTGYPLGMLPVTSNGLVPPNLPYSHPLQAMNLPNGMNPDIVYNSQPPNFSLFQPTDNCSNAVYVTSTNSGVYSTAPPPHIVPTHSESTNGKGKVINCFNCGEAGHRAVDCREQSMESLTHNGYHLNMCAKSDSE